MRLLAPLRYLSYATLLISVTAVTARPPKDQIEYSPEHQVALLELYTSEGCSSCPPADRWLSKLHSSLVDSDLVVPLALHITYWDYIGWRDEFAQSRFDDRQRNIAKRANSRRIYTPQFVLNGRDFRGLGRFVSNIEEVNKNPAKIRLGVAVETSKDTPDPIAWLFSEKKDSLKNDVSLYLAVYENTLESGVDAGENEGRVLKHDRVVRRLYGPMKQGLVQFEHAISLDLAKDWRRDNLGLAVFAQDDKTGEILQVVQLKEGTF